MASLVKNKKNYGLIWTDSSKRPTQVRESLKTDVLKKAKRKKAALEHAYWEGRHDPWHSKWYEAKPKTDSLFVGDAVELFISHKTTIRGHGGWNNTTATNEAATLRLFARLVGGKPIRQLTKTDLKDFYYRDGVNSDHTRNSLYISVNALLNWCKSEGYLESKPEFKPAKPQTKLPKYIELQKIEALINKCQHDWIALAWLVLAGTGMRPVELAHIKDIYVQKDSILIGGDFTTKVRAERRVPLLFESGQAVAVLLQMNPESSYLLGHAPSYSKQKISRIFTSCWRKCFADHPKRSLYNLKDTFAVRFLSDESIDSASGMKINDLKEILGHASLNTTQRYLKAVPYGTTLEGDIETDIC